MNSPPKILLSWITDPNYIPPLRLSSEQITTIPELDTAYNLAPSELFAPRGEYDLPGVLQQAGVSKAFDLVVVWSDPSGSNFPRNLSAFPCPKLLIVGDTHHMKTPLQKMIAYAQSEPFDFIVSSYDRHHLHWFTEAGFPKVAWIPGAIVRHMARPRLAKRTSQVVMIGQIGHLHKRRAGLIEHLKRHGVPTVAGQAPRETAADLYSQSVISLNCSLNGDLNLRVFEILSAGGFLLTDRLGPETGLERLFEEESELVSYASPEELLEKVRYYLEHPDRAAEIARRGNQRFLNEHLPEMKATAILDWIFKDQLDPRYDIKGDTRATPNSDIGANLQQRLRFYEMIQAAHENRETIAILLESSVPSCFVTDIFDLPRVRASLLPKASGQRNTLGENQLSEKARVCTENDVSATCWDFVVWPLRNKPQLLQRKIQTAAVVYV